jgi:nicotinic acid phosphoribosyltransferase
MTTTTQEGTEMGKMKKHSFWKSLGFVSKAREVELLEEIYFLEEEIEYLEQQRCIDKEQIAYYRDRSKSIDLNAKLHELGERYKILYAGVSNELS